MTSIKTAWLGAFLALLLNGCGSLPSLTDTQDGSDSTKPAKPADSALQRRFGKALELLREGDLESADKAFQQLADDNPRLAGPLTNIGIIRLKQSDPVAAEKAFRDALARNPKGASAHNQLGIALRLQGRFQEAEEAYQKALKLAPGYLLAHRNLGILYDLYLAKPKQALEQYRLYQKLAEAPDHEIEGWILDLERRTGGEK